MSHIALVVRDADESIDFYARYAGMQVVHCRTGSRGGRIVWLSDLQRPFALVLIEGHEPGGRLEGIAHLGVACESRGRIDRLCEDARREGRLRMPPRDDEGPAGYWALLRDPDGHNLELSYGQEVAAAVSEARSAGAAPPA